METTTPIRYRQQAKTGPVIVGLDDSDSALDAIALGRRLADALGSSAVLTHVRPLHVLDGFSAVVAERLATATDRTQVLPARSVTAGLTAFARREEAAAIVVGSSAKSVLGRLLPGGTGARLLRRSSVPVAVAPAGYAETETRIAEIGVGFDGSEDSRAALAWAAAAARDGGSTLRIIGVHEPVPIDRLALTGGLASPAFSAAVREQQEKRLAIGATELADGLAVEPELRDGTITDALIDASETLDLLVLGTRGLGRLRGAVLGSVSAAVVEAARSPVVVVPSATP
jgi:nucleotide-binding universal stress UspA family protein